jgi:guanylate kinase
MLREAYFMQVSYPNHGMLFVFSGPSGTGKNTIMDQLKKTDPTLRQLPTATTRCKRDNEEYGREHEFLSLAEFRQRILNKSLIEWQIIHHESVYGVPRQTIQNAIQQGETLIADVDVLGALRLKEEFGAYVVLVFIEPPNLATLEERLRGRSDIETELELQMRMRRVAFEMSFASRYDYRIVNYEGELETSVQKAYEIVCQNRENPPRTNFQLGWDPKRIRQRVTGIIIQENEVLYQENQLPYIHVPQEKLPFEALRQFILDELHIHVIPQRPDIELRMLDIIFEPPQIVQTIQEGEIILQNMIYILHPEIPLKALPPHWTFHPLQDLDPKFKEFISMEVNQLS